MNLSLLLHAPPVIQLHASAAIAALAPSANQLLGPKATLPHRMLGTPWALHMIGVALSSFFFH